MRTASKALLLSIAPLLAISCNRSKTSPSHHNPQDPGSSESHPHAPETQQPDENPNNRLPYSPYAPVVEGLPHRTNASLLRLRVTGHNLRTYRFKIGPDDLTDCSNTTDYSEPRLAEEDLLIDQSSLPDGRVVLCAMNLDADTNNPDLYHSEALAHTYALSSRTWIVDRTGPRDFRIEPIAENSLPHQAVSIHWTTPRDETASGGFELSYARVEHGCENPVQTLTLTTNEVLLNDPLPHGRYIVCLKAFDDLGNAGEATNSGTAYFDTPAVVHLAYFKGETTEDKKLYYATRVGFGSDWSEKSIPLTGGATRFIGPASLQLLAEETPQLVFQATEPALLAPPQAVVRLARIDSESNFDVERIDNMAAAEGTSFITPLTVSSDGIYHLFFTTASPDGSSLGHLFGQSGSTPSHEPLGHFTAEQAITDTNAAIDAAGHIHLAYVSGGSIFYSRKDSSWSTPQNLPLEGCQHVAFASLAVARTTHEQTAVAISYLCSKETEPGPVCELRFAQLNREGATWSSALVDRLNTAACFPFSADRPTLAIDFLGQAYVAYRYPNTDGSGSFDIAIAKGSLHHDFTVLKRFEDWSKHTGSAKLTLDAGFRPSLAYASAGGIRFAWLDSANQWQLETVVATASSTYVEPADLAISGGSVRALAPFAPVPSVVP